MFRNCRFRNNRAVRLRLRLGRVQPRLPVRQFARLGASLFDGLTAGMLSDPAFSAIVDQDLRNGQHRNPERRPGWFTTAYFHRPNELAEEAEEAGHDVVQVVGLEGIACWLPHLAASFDNPREREQILAAARLIETEPSLLGLSAHLLLVARAGSSAAFSGGPGPTNSGAS